MRVPPGFQGASRTRPEDDGSVTPTTESSRKPFMKHPFEESPHLLRRCSSVQALNGEFEVGGGEEGEDDDENEFSSDVSRAFLSGL